MKEMISSSVSWTLPGNGKFRLAGPEDLPEVLKLFRSAILAQQAAGIDQWDEIYPDKTILSKDIHDSHMFLLWRDGCLHSAVVLDEDPLAEYAQICWSFEIPRIAALHRLCVSPEVQGKGIGKETMRLAERLLTDSGCRTVRLDAFSGNPAALHLYEGGGYRRAGSLTFCKGLFYCYEKQLEGKNEIKDT